MDGVSLSHDINHCFKSEIHYNVTYDFYSRLSKNGTDCMGVPLILHLADVDSTSTYESLQNSGFVLDLATDRNL